MGRKRFLAAVACGLVVGLLVGARSVRAVDIPLGGERVLEVHGFYESQLRYVGEDAPFNGLSFSQFRHLLSIETDVDIFPDGYGPFDTMNAFTRWLIVYECIYSRACGLFDSADSYGDRANRLPQEYKRARSDGPFIAGKWPQIFFTGSNVSPRQRLNPEDRYNLCINGPGRQPYPTAFPLTAFCNLNSRTVLGFPIDDTPGFPSPAINRTRAGAFNQVAPLANLLGLRAELIEREFLPQAGGDRLEALELFNEVAELLPLTPAQAGVIRALQAAVEQGQPGAQEQLDGFLARLPVPFEDTLNGYLLSAGPGRQVVRTFDNRPNRNRWLDLTGGSAPELAEMRWGASRGHDTFYNALITFDTPIRPLGYFTGGTADTVSEFGNNLAQNASQPTVKAALVPFFTGPDGRQNTADDLPVFQGFEDCGSDEHCGYRVLTSGGSFMEVNAGICPGGMCPFTIPEGLKPPEDPREPPCKDAAGNPGILNGLGQCLQLPRDSNGFLNSKGDAALADDSRPPEAFLEPQDLTGYRAGSLPARPDGPGQGLYFKTAGLQKVLASTHHIVSNLDLEFREDELEWSHGASQDEHEFREGYVEFEMFDSQLFARLGKLLMVWGKTELFRNQDRLNPLDIGIVTLPSLEESRIGQWAADLIWYWGYMGPIEDFRTEFVAVLDDFEPTDLGKCGEPFVFLPVCQKSFGAMASGLVALGLVGEDRPPDPWDDIKGMDIAARIEGRWNRFTFSISDFWGYDDSFVIELVHQYGRRVDVETGAPVRSTGALDCNQAPGGPDGNPSTAADNTVPFRGNCLLFEEKSCLLPLTAEGRCEGSCVSGTCVTGREGQSCDDNRECAIGAAGQGRCGQTGTCVVGRVGEACENNQECVIPIGERRAPGDVALAHYANQTIFHTACTLTFNQDDGGCPLDTLNNNLLLDATSKVLAGDPALGELAVLGVDTIRTLPADRAFFFSPQDFKETRSQFDELDQPTIGGLFGDVGDPANPTLGEPSLTQEQQALLGCGKAFNSGCDQLTAEALVMAGLLPEIAGGIDLLNADASVLTQEWAVLKVTTPGALVGTRNGASGPYFEAGITAPTLVDLDGDGTPETGFTPVEASAVRDAGSDPLATAPGTGAVAPLSTIGSDYQIEPFTLNASARWRALGVLLYDPNSPNPDGENCTPTTAGGVTGPEPTCTPLERLSANLERLLITNEIFGPDDTFDPPESFEEMAVMFDASELTDSPFVTRGAGDPLAGADGIFHNNADLDGDGLPDTKPILTLIDPNDFFSQLVGDPGACPEVGDPTDPSVPYCYLDITDQLIATGVIRESDASDVLRYVDPIPLQIPVKDFWGGRLLADPHPPNSGGVERTPDIVAESGVPKLLPSELAQLIEAKTTADLAGFSPDDPSRFVVVDFLRESGDVDTSGFTNTVDALRIARGEVTSEQPGFDNCDVDRDGLCNTTDALAIARGEVGVIRLQEMQEALFEDFFDPLERLFRDFDLNNVIDADEDGDELLDFIDDFTLGPISDDNILCGSGIPGDPLQEALQAEFFDESDYARIGELFPNFPERPVGPNGERGRLPPRSPVFCGSLNGLLNITGQTLPARRAGGDTRFGRRDFLWHGGRQLILDYQKKNVLGFGLDFAEDRTKSSWGIEFSWTSGKLFGNTLSYDGLHRSDEYVLSISMDRPTFVNFLNPNRTFFINFQFFLRYFSDYVGGERRGMFGTADSPWDSRFVLFFFTGYFQDRLTPNITAVFDPPTSTAALLSSLSYRISDKFLMQVGLNHFFGHVSQIQTSFFPVSLLTGPDTTTEAVRGIAPARNRDEAFLRLRYTF